MNDFTKQELEYLKLAIYERPHSATEEMDAMRKTIQSMIESHEKPCEHKNFRRVSLIDGHEYHICTNCIFITKIR